MDFLYQFNLGLIAPLFTGSFHEMFEIFFFFQKFAGLWLVGKVDNHVAIYGSKVADGFSAFQRRLVYFSESSYLVLSGGKLSFFEMWSTTFLDHIVVC